MQLREAQVRLEQLLAMKVAVPPEVSGKEKIILYGAGNLGALALEFLKHVGITPVAILDRAAKPNDTLQGVAVYTPQDYAVSDAVVLVTINNMAYAPIAASLHALGWKAVLPFYDYARAFRYRHPLDNGWFAGVLDADDKAQMIKAMAGWADDWSRSAYLQFLAWRIAREEWSFDDAPVNPGDRFFIPEVIKALPADAVIIDGGAYDGRVLKKWLEVVGTFREAHCFEPDAVNAASLKAAVATMPEAARIHIYAQALSDHNGTLSLQSGFGMASRIEAGGEAVEAVTLDSLKLAPGFIKLHLEGGEYAAIQGALETIHTHCPVLVATVYHNRDGLWKTAALLMEKLNNYRFYFRAHAWCGTGAVIYAVPEGR